MNEYMAGDTVVVRCHGMWGRYLRLGTVEAVTPTGQIRLTDKTRFSAEGCEIGGGDRLLPGSEANLALHAAQELRCSIRKQAEALLAKLPSMELEALQRASEGLLLATNQEPVANTQEQRVL